MTQNDKENLGAIIGYVVLSYVVNYAFIQTNYFGLYDFRYINPQRDVPSVKAFIFVLSPITVLFGLLIMIFECCCKALVLLGETLF